MITVVLLMLCYQYWAREIWFFRRVKNVSANSDCICSPVDGTVVYRRFVSEGEDVYGSKLGESHYCGVANETSLHIGLYMTIFDRHFVCAPVKSRIVNVEHWKGALNYPMLDLVEYTNVMFRARFNDWMQRSRKWLLANERMIVTLESEAGVQYRVIMIGEKYVNKIVMLGDKVWYEQGEPFAQIKRGSQTDLLIPTGLVATDNGYVPYIGQKMKIGESLEELSK